MEQREYILGTDPLELARLAEQHEVWREAQLALIERAGIAPGVRVLDLGSGPGYTTFELARSVGPSGRVVARDQSERFLAFLEEEARRRGHANIETSLGPAEELDESLGSFDAVYSRWLFSWLRDPAQVLTRVAERLVPGGVVLLQEYLDWATFALVPPEPAFDAVIAACMRSWELGEGQIDVARALPSLAPASGLAIEHLAPLSRIARADEPEWRWLGGFFESYLPRLVQRGLLDAGTVEAHLADWRARVAAGTAYCVTPTLADAVLRKR